MSDDQPTTDEIQRLTGPGTIISLVLAVGLVVGVIIAARIAYDHAEHQPVTLNTIDAPGASSEECSSLIDNLPNHLGSYDRVSLSDPAPDGAAVWIDGDNRITLRCGVQPPDSYTALSTTEEHGKDESGGQSEGIRWLGIADARGGDKPVTDSVTWYTLGRAQEVAVTGPEDVADDLSDLSGALHHNPVSDASATAHPTQTPLSTLPVTDEAARGKQCRSVLDTLPGHFGALQRTTKDALGNDLPDGMAAWTAPRRDPVVVRCGVQQPERRRIPRGIRRRAQRRTRPRTLPHRRRITPGTHWDTAISSLFRCRRRREIASLQRCPTQSARIWKSPGIKRGTKPEG